MRAADWLRRTVQRTIDRSGRHDGRHSIDDASLINLLDSAHLAHQAAVEGSELAVTKGARQLSGLESAAADIRLLIGRHRDVDAAGRRVREALERARLVALNAGLEGVRMDEPAGRVVASISDEVRQAVGRSLDALDEHLKLLEQLDHQRKKLHEQFQTTQTSAGELQQILVRAQELQSKALDALTELLDRAQQATGADRHTLRWMSQVGAQAHQLLRLFGEMPVGAARTVALEALRPVLCALERRLRSLDTDGASPPDRPDQEP